MNAPLPRQAAADEAEFQTSLAEALAQDGALDEADAAYAEALAADPDCLAALVGAGRLRLTRGDAAGAAPLLEQARMLRPDLAGLAVAAAEAHKAAGDGAAAAAAYRGALAADPGQAGAAEGLAHLLLSLGQAAAAAEVADGHLRHNPDDGAVHYLRGVAAQRLQQPAVACRHLERAAALLEPVPEVIQAWLLALAAAGDAATAARVAQAATARWPRDGELWRIVGAVRRVAGDLDGAEAALATSLRLAPDRPETLLQLAHVAAARGDIAARRDWLLEVHALGRADAALLNDIGLTLQQQGRYTEALDWFRRATVVEPDCVPALNNIAAAHARLGDGAKALPVLQRVVALAPELSEAQANLAGILQNFGMHEEAIERFRALLTRDAGYRSAWPCLLHSQLMLCDWHDLDRVHAETLAAVEALADAGRGDGVMAFGLLNSPASMGLRRKVAEALSAEAKRQVAGAALAAPPAIRRRGDRLRVGYISADFRNHSVATVFKPVLDAHDRDRFEWFGYSLVFGDDDMRRHFARRFDRFVDIAGAGYVEAAQAIADDGLDLLVDLAGLQTGRRYEALALKPAPVQAHWLGYGATVGGDYIDYLITDAACTPPAFAADCAEKLVTLPHSFMPVAPDLPDRAAPTRAEAGLPEDAFVFANFNEPYKLEPQVWDLWMRLLRDHPAAVLWLVDGPAQASSNLRREARARGVDPDRIVFAERWPRPAHLARIPLADLGLDTLYHVGGVTTADCLWRGLPVLCWAGPSPNARTGVSLLRACRADGLVAQTPGDYAAMASGFVREPARLQHWRDHLARRDLPAFDVKRLATDLERAYETMVGRHRDGLPPADFALD